MKTLFTFLNLSIRINMYKYILQIAMRKEGIVIRKSVESSIIAQLLKSDRIYCDRVECTSVYDPPFSLAKLKTHDVIEISFVERGSGVHQIASQAIPCTQGDVYMMHRNIPHGYFLTDRKSELTIKRILFDVGDWFENEVSAPDSSRFCYGIFSDSEQCAYAMLNAKILGEVNALFEVIAAELEKKGEEWQDFIKANLMLLLITLGRYVNGAIKSIPEISSREWRKATQTLQIISERFGESSLTLESIAQELFTSQSHLSRAFKDLTGKSFSEYLKEVRINHACKLLSDTRLYVEDIMQRCGLKDITSFYRNFQRHTGMTPTQYRSAHSKSCKVERREDETAVMLSEISLCLQQGKTKIVTDTVRRAIEAGCTPEEILEKGLLHGMNVIGERFKKSEIYVPEVLVAARAMNMGARLLRPLLMAKSVASRGRVCLGTVQGDLHDIGKNLVKMMMEGAGLEVIDLGVDVPPEAFIQTAIEQGCQVIACSALLTTTMGVVGEIVELAEKAGIREKVKIMVGGAPTSEAFCKAVGADCYTDDAASAANAALELCRQALCDGTCQNKEK